MTTKYSAQSMLGESLFLDCCQWHRSGGTDQTSCGGDAIPTPISDPETTPIPAQSMSALVVGSAK